MITVLEENFMKRVPSLLVDLLDELKELNKKLDEMNERLERLENKGVEK